MDTAQDWRELADTWRNTIRDSICEHMRDLEYCNLCLQEQKQISAYQCNISLPYLFWPSDISIKRGADILQQKYRLG